MATPGSPYPVSANAEPRDLFLSYNSRDREAVLQVRQALTLRQVSSFFDRADLTVGQLWFDELEVALRSVRGVAVFIGKDRLGTIQKREMQFALARQAAEEIKGRKFPVIPIFWPASIRTSSPGFSRSTRGSICGRRSANPVHSMA